MAFIWRIIEYKMTDKSEYQPILNPSKTYPKLIQNHSDIDMQPEYKYKPIYKKKYLY